MYPIFNDNKNAFNPKAVSYSSYFILLMNENDSSDVLISIKMNQFQMFYTQAEMHVANINSPILVEKNMACTLTKNIRGYLCAKGDKM